MNAIICFWRNFARWVKQGHAQPLPLMQRIPVESWADRKRDFERAQRSHRGQRDAYAHLRKSTNEALLHPNLFRDANTIAFVAAVMATARQSVGARQ